MLSSLLALFFMIAVVAHVILIVKAFQTSAGWGLAVLFLPFGNLAFACNHWQEARTSFVVSFCANLVFLLVLFNDPPVTEGFWKGYAEGRQRALAARGLREDGRSAAPHSPRAPHEVRDLADNEPPGSPAPTTALTPPDPYATQRAALVRHGADLQAEYQRLSAERTALKPGNKAALAAFNVQAAHYQRDVQALQAEQAQLDVLDHPGKAAAGVAKALPDVGNGGHAAASAGVETEANAALLRLHASVAEGNYAGFAATLRKCLADYRRTAAFPRITAYAQQVIRDASAARLSAALQQQGRAAQSEYDLTTRQVQAIVNQTPPTVVPPRGSTEVYWSLYDPGAIKPDFNVADVVTGREAAKGDYTYMKVRPGVFYRSTDCEFNPQTKFFYTDRSVPKKKLTDAENQEIVRLYRTLGKDETILTTLSQRLARAPQTSAELVALNTQLDGAK